MSTQGNLTREQAVTIVGAAALAKVNALNCEFTGRLQCDGDTRDEFAASVRCEDIDGDECTLTAYYYQEADDVAAVESLDQLGWEVQGYAIT